MKHLQHNHELYIGNINGLVCRHSYGEPIKLMDYLIAGKKLTFLLPENYRECINGLQGFRQSVLRVLDAESLKDQITVVTYKVDNSDIIDKVTELGESMKFDVCVMNPPYERSLHLKILEKVLTFCDKTVNISPVRWLQDPLCEYKKNSDYNRYKNSILNYLTQVNALSQQHVNDLFGIQFNSIIGISVYSHDNSSYDYNKLHISSFNSIYSKCMLKAETCPKIILYKDSNKTNFVPICLLGGHVDVSGYGVRFARNRYKYFTNGLCQNAARSDLYGKTPEEVKAYNLKSFDTVSVCQFNTEHETKNFYSFITTKCFEYITRGHTMDGHILPNMLPFVKDYSNPWTDEHFCKYFNITGYISDTEAEPGSEWEIILNEMKPYTTDK